MNVGPDPTLVPIFEAEVAEIVDTLQAHLLRLEQGVPESAALLTDMLRLTHDVKGSARVVGYQHVSHLAHAFESRLMLWRGAEVVTPAEISIALAANDLLLKLTMGRQSAELVERAAELSQTLEDASRGRTLPPAAPSQAHANSKTAASAAPAQPRKRPPAMRVLQANDSLRVPRDRIESVVDAVADALVAVLASADQVKGLRAASHELQMLERSIKSVWSREASHVRVELHGTISRVCRQVDAIAEALRPIDAHLREVDVRARDLCLVPFEPVAMHLERVARDTAAKLGREVAIAVEGRDSLIDKELADAIKGPLTHAITNAIDHGIEPPAEREQAGKPRAGTLTLSLAIEAGQWLHVTLRDDGRGIDSAAVRARLGAQAEGLDDSELLALLLRAGVSTRETVTEISGRGVGLSSLAAVAEDLRGDATLHSEQHVGTTLELRLPLKASLLQGLPVRAAGCQFIVPAEGLVSVRTPCASAVPLAEVLGLPGGEGGSEVLVMRGRNGGVAGVTVDQIGSMREVVLRPLGAHLGRARFVEGVTIVGEGEPALILDLREVAEACTQVPEATVVNGTPPASDGRRVLVVDDSVTLRASLNASLVKAGYEVSLAGDGLAALALLGRTGCDAIVSDVQMPRMDGWQLLEHCAGRVPFVLMTARPEPDGARRAQQSGACAYLSKDDALGERVVAALHTALSPFQESYP